MYIHIGDWLHQHTNNAVERTYLPGMDLCTCGLDPQLDKCSRPLWPGWIHNWCKP